MVLYSNTDKYKQSQYYNLTKLRKRKNKYTIQFFKVESHPPTQPILASPPYGVLTLKLRNSNPPKKSFENQKVSPHSSGGWGGEHHDINSKFILAW